jgi:hypothetical protein
MARPVSDIVKKEIVDFKDAVSRLRSGALDDLEFKKIRLLYGIYGQKQKSPEGVQMIRVKIPGGIMNAGQLRALSILAEKYSTGIGHITTRQNFQFHFIKLDDVPAILELLDSVALTSREGCGSIGCLWRRAGGVGTCTSSSRLARQEFGQCTSLSRGAGSPFLSPPQPGRSWSTSHRWRCPRWRTVRKRTRFCRRFVLIGSVRT